MLSNSNAAIRSHASTSLAGQNAATSGVTNGTHKASHHSSLAEKANPTRPLSYFGHSSEEVTRLLIQALTDMGYQAAAESVSRDSGIHLESPTVAAFRAAVLGGLWAEAERLLADAVVSEGCGGGRNGLVLAVGSDRNVMKFWLRQQKFLELLEQRDTSRALVVLRGELTPLYQDTGKLHFLSSLLMCRTAEDLMAKAHWDGARGQSRRRLLSQLSRCISPSVMLPEHRLAVLLEQVKQTQIDNCLYHTEASSPSLYSDHHCDRRNFPADKAVELNDLGGEVWQVQFSHDGSKLGACGSRGSVVIWDVKTFTVLKELSDHDEGVGHFAWSPDDRLIVSCSQDKYARLWDAETGSLIKKVRRFEEPVSSCVWARDSASFVLGTLDKKYSLCSFNVHDDGFFDWKNKHRVQDLCGSPDGRWLVAVDDKSSMHVYSGLTRELEYHLDMGVRLTSVSISQDSRHLLVNRKDGEAQLVDLTTRNSVQKFLGHKGGIFLIRSSFGGANESFVTSGSDDGNILIWHKNTGVAVERLHGHVPRCNVVSWSPSDPRMLASGGDDGRVKVWTNKSKMVEPRARHPKPSNGWKSANEEA